MPKERGVLYNNGARMRVSLMAYARHNVVPLPRSEKARANVTIDGLHYASFVDLDHARTAVVMWRHNWPAVEGKRLMAWSSTGNGYEMLDD